ncbi:hypothetical protein KXS07_23730 [Inquilinus limosus]|uniref:hypothetical protein n=1 Tax=Inquilinus limosus TaxID=171674 RepID=UPI003F16AF6A
MSNPFDTMAGLVEAGLSSGYPPELAQVLRQARDLWAAIDALPSKPEAVLAQRRLQETVFWAGQSAAGPALKALDQVLAMAREAQP